MGARRNVRELLIEKARNGEKIASNTDAPRRGRHRKAFRSIRDCEPIRRLIHAECMPDSPSHGSQNVLMVMGKF
jgi:hypothetical protein